MCVKRDICASALAPNQPLTFEAGIPPLIEIADVLSDMQKICCGRVCSECGKEIGKRIGA